MRPRVLLLTPTTTYRAKAFIDAALGLDVDITVASEQANVLTQRNPGGLLTLDFADAEKATATIREFIKTYPVHGVVGVDDQATITAAAIASALSLPCNSMESVVAARNKYRMRQRFARHALPTPAFTIAALHEDAAVVARRVRFPCVVKPLLLSGSRGVIRANDANHLTAAIKRVGAILRQANVADREQANREVLIEDFIPGSEVALEGLLSDGQLRVLAIFDKPDPLDGPFFPETIYITPSRLAADVQVAIAEQTGRAAHALGLSIGPIHAELRINRQGVWMIELAARSIGGYCSQVLRFAQNTSLEELILRQALSMDTKYFQRERQAAGVMMIPVPYPGTLQEISGLEKARAIPQIDQIIISARQQQRLNTLPDEATYLGFIFARGEDPDEVDLALREAYSELKFVIMERNPKVAEHTLRRPAG